MKTPIEAADLVGQKVRVNDGATEVSVIAYAARPTYLIEFPDGTRQVRAASEFEYEPPVELPTDDHHIGWLTAPGTELAREDVLGEWFFGDGPKITSSGLSGIPRDKVTRWTPVVAVPASALDELRAFQADHLCCNHVGDFLAAVDAANGDAS